MFNIVNAQPGAFSGGGWFTFTHKHGSSVFIIHFPAYVEYLLTVALSFELFDEFSSVCIA